MARVELMKTQKHTALILAVLISTLGLLIVNLSYTTGAEECPKVRNEVFPSVFNESSPIIIDGNADFANQAKTNSWPGNGTLGNPYLITALNFTSDSTSAILLSISNTDVHFSVERNLLVGGSVAIHLNNVTNGALINNTICDSNTNGILAIVAKNIQIANNTIYNIIDYGQGMYCNQVVNSVILNNTIQNCGDRGLLLDYCKNCTLLYNTIFGNDGAGIGLRDSNTHRIHRNDIYNNGMEGIFLGKAPYCNITENIIYGNEGPGIEQQVSDNCLVEANVIYCNLGSGIRVGGDDSMIKNNTFYNNPKWAIRVFTGNVTILYNNFIDNGDSPERMQAMDDGTGTIIDNNYWSDWTHQDVNNDGIVDFPYWISSDKETIDYHPHILPYLEYRLHVLSTPVILFPNETFPMLFDEINVTWGRAGDTFGHNMTYSLYYSTDGVSWNEITSGIKQTHFLWNVTLLPDNINYSLKVVSVCSDGLSTARFTAFTFEIRTHSLTIPTVFYPNGGELINGSCHISCHPANDSLDHTVTYSLYYSTKGGSSWALVIANLFYPDYEWDVSILAPGSSYLIKVSATCSEGLTVEDMSDSTFILNSHTLQKPTLTYPNGGEIVGSNVEIIWEPAIDSWGHNVLYNISISSDGGGTWNTLAESCSYNRYSWDTASFLNGLTYKVRVVAYCEGGLVVEDTSDEVFTVNNVVLPLLTLVTILSITIAVIVVFWFVRRKSKTA